MTPFFLWHFSGYPVKIMRFSMIFNGFGGITMPVAAIMSGFYDVDEFSVKQSTLHGAKIIGHITVATAGMSLRRNRKNLSFSFGEPGLVSALKTGCTLMRLNPQWNSMFAFDGIGSWFSIVRFSLKCIVDSLHS